MSKDLFERFPADDEQVEHFKRTSHLRGFGPSTHPLKHTMKQIRLGEDVNVEGFGVMTVGIEEGKPVLRKK